MLPFAAHPLAHCSATRIRRRVGLGSRSKLPTPKYVPPKPASRSTRFVQGAVQVSCETLRGRPRTPTASGDTRCGSDRPGVAPVQLRHTLWASRKAPTFWRGLTCQVTRALAFSNVRSEYSRRFVSGSYSHFDGSPALR